MTDTPSRAALDAAVKPAGFESWDNFNGRNGGKSGHHISHAIALAYAADLDKADKQNREVLELLDGGMVGSAYETLRANLLPEPKPALLEEFAATIHNFEYTDMDFQRGAKAFADWIAKRELAKEQDRG